MSHITPLDLLVLGFLHDQPMHGYEIIQRLKTEKIDIWFRLSPAGVYYALGKLRDRKLVSESRSQRSGSGSGQKSVFHLTESGREIFFAALEEQLAGEEQICFTYHVGIYFLNRMPAARILAAMEKRKAYLQKWFASILSHIENTPPEPADSLYTILDHLRRYLTLEQTWLEEIISVVGGGNDQSSKITPSLMSLSGTLRQYHLPDLIRLIASGRQTGLLQVTDGTLSRSICFTDGQPLGYVCRGGKPTELSPQDNGNSQFPTEDAPHEPDYCEGLDAIFDLFRWQEGSFVFHQAITPSETCQLLNMTAEQLILQGSRWVDNWEIIQQLVPSTETVFETDISMSRMQAMGPTPNELLLYSSLDGIREIPTLAQDLGMTLFEVSRTLYSLAAVGAIRSADKLRLRLRRTFREIAELMCRSTITWRASPDDRECEQEVNARCTDIPIQLVDGRIADQTPPDLRTDALISLYKRFLRAQLEVVGNRFGVKRAQLSFNRTIRQLVPELQDAAREAGFLDLIHDVFPPATLAD